MTVAEVVEFICSHQMTDAEIRAIVDAMETRMERETRRTNSDAYFAASKHLARAWYALSLAPGVKR